MRSHLVAAKCFDAYVKARMGSGSVPEAWDRTCSAQDVLQLCGVTKKWLKKQAPSWTTGFLQKITSLADAGYTNGQVVCMRGELTYRRACLCLWDSGLHYSTQLFVVDACLF